MSWVVLYDLNVKKLFNKVKSHHFTWKALYTCLFIYLVYLYIAVCNAFYFFFIISISFFPISKLNRKYCSSK